MDINHTVVHSAILEAKAFFGRLSVIWERVLSPNIEYPIAANDPYIAVHITKLFRIKSNKLTNRKPNQFTNHFAFIINFPYPYHMNKALLNLVRSDIDW